LKNWLGEGHLKHLEPIGNKNKKKLQTQVNSFFIILKYELKRVKYHIPVLYFKAHLQLVAESQQKLVAPNSNLHQKLVANQNKTRFDK
jgi:hypothetical protein